MKSFPSAFNRGGNSAVARGKHEDEHFFSNAANTNQLNDIKAKDLTMNSVVRNYLFSDTNASNFNRRIRISNVKRRLNTNAERIFENPAFIPSKILSSFNTYMWLFDKPIRTYYDEEKQGKNVSTISADFPSAPSLFNPQFNVQAIGFTRNIPLVLDYNFSQSGAKRTQDITNCNIERLVNDSLKPQSPLGQARYRLADFLFCKDLGKVSNNHLITLRKFPLPVDDNIFEYSGAKYAGKKENSNETTGDIARLVSWFGTDDNKLEDICKYDTQYTWKQVESKIQDIHTDKENTNDNFLTKAVNTFGTNGKNYFNYALTTGDGGNDLISHFLGKLSPRIKTADNSNNDYWRYIDQNKVYTPLNTIWDNNYPEGRLIMKQEFNLTFSYKLRAYENINPRAALLDLIGNILECTYYRGKFWGGRIRTFGPPHAGANWRKANNLIDNAWNKLEGMAGSLAAGTFDFGSVIGAISSMVERGKEAVQQLFAGGTKEFLSEAGKGMEKIAKVTNLSAALKGSLKNTLGRPALYGADSLVSGDNFGPWHLTVGNPYNPIMSIGNLIMTNATIQHSGPLGADDFPTELKVSCSLKAARSRDIVGISKYYTKGQGAIYMVNAHQSFEDHYKLNGFNAEEYEKEREKYLKSVEATNDRNAAKAEGPQEEYQKNPMDDAFMQEMGFNSKSGNEWVSNITDDEGWYYDSANSACMNDYNTVKIGLLNDYSAFHSILKKDQIA